MGDYSKKISLRLRSARVKEGYCLVCGDYGSLSQDHVPPKCCAPLAPVEQRLVVEMTLECASEYKGVTARNGSSFRTICVRCNRDFIGTCDEVTGKACAELRQKIAMYFDNSHGAFSIVSAKINAVTFARSMIGHILSATSSEACIDPPERGGYFEPLRRFVMGLNPALHDTHDIYYWFYPKNMHVSARHVQFYNQGHHATISILAFYPIAFMVTKRGEGTYPAHAIRFNLSDDSLMLDLSLHNISYASFPFCEIRGNQMYAMRDSEAIVSYPQTR